MIPSWSDPHNLERFIRAQEPDYERALQEISRGQKRSHWMWYIFPHIDGLAASPTAKHFAIKGLAEARAYLDHPVLGPRLLRAAEAVAAFESRTAREIFGTPDDLKLRSSATLFAVVEPPGSVFHRLLGQYYDGKPDDRTLELLEKGS
jgi:uncharacterized protein (DUF1810 family)